MEITTKFKIVNVNLLSTWCYNLKNNVDCTICRNNLNADSIYAQESRIESCVITGICGHSFHQECITPWVKSNPHCPICSSKWSVPKK